jgi:hypothetical protein
VLPEDPPADCDQDQASGNLCVPAHKDTHPFPEEKTAYADNEGHDTDYQRRLQSRLADERKAHPDSERIDAGRDREKQHYPFARKVPFPGIIAGRAGTLLGRILPLLENLDEHFPSDGGKEPEGDPVVGGLDQRAERRTEKPAGKRHQELEKAESGSGPEHMVP